MPYYQNPPKPNLTYSHVPALFLSSYSKLLYQSFPHSPTLSHFPTCSLPLNPGPLNQPVRDGGRSGWSHPTAPSPDTSLRSSRPNSNTITPGTSPTTSIDLGLGLGLFNSLQTSTRRASSDKERNTSSTQGGGGGGVSGGGGGGGGHGITPQDVSSGGGVGSSGKARLSGGGESTYYQHDHKLNIIIMNIN